jgi:hypothetical protein
VASSKVFEQWRQVFVQNSPPVMMALDEARRLLARGGWCYQHVQAIMVSFEKHAGELT